MKKIVVIEDNAEMRENIEEILELADYEVLSASDGKEGVELVKAEIPDLIICDIMMPSLDGYGVLYYLSKIPQTNGIPFIFLTAKAERSDMRKGMNMGADDYITKPFDEMELLSAVESRIEKRKRFEAIQEQDDKWPSFKNVVYDLSGLDELRNESITKKYDKKAIIYSEDEMPKHLFYVEKGHVRNYRVTKDAKELVTGLWGPGEFFGYNELLSQKNYQEYAMTLEGAEVTLISKDAFEKLILANKDVSINFIKLLAGSVLEREQSLVNLAYNTVRKRVANALARLHDKFKKDSDTFTVDIKITREELASMVGTAPESVIRVLSEFKDDEYILTKGSLITILDIDALRNYKF